MARTAQDTLAYCGSCKMDLSHTIVAMQGDRVLRVQCRTCRKEHAFKSPKGVNDPMAVKKAAAAKKSKKSAEEGAGGPSPVEMEWEKLMNQHKATPTKPYSAKGNFNLGDKIAHPTFGDGIVGKLIFPNKLEIIFRTDVKVLIHAGVA